VAFARRLRAWSSFVSQGAAAVPWGGVPVDELGPSGNATAAQLQPASAPSDWYPRKVQQSGTKRASSEGLKRHELCSITLSRTSFGDFASRGLGVESPWLHRSPEVRGLASHGEGLFGCRCLSKVGYKRAARCARATGRAGPTSPRLVDQFDWLGARLINPVLRRVASN